MAKKKTARKTSKGKKKAAPRKATPRKAAPRKAARGKKTAAKRRPTRGKAKGVGVAVVELAEIGVIVEPEETGHDDDEFPPDYGGSE